MWDEQLRWFGDRHRAIAPDFMGFGGSDAPEGWRRWTNRPDRRRRRPQERAPAPGPQGPQGRPPARRGGGHLGGSKQRRHLPAGASHEEKLHARQAGRRPGGRS
jgi:hypothetical protein